MLDGACFPRIVLTLIEGTRFRCNDSNVIVVTSGRFKDPL